MGTSSLSSACCDSGHYVGGGTVQSGMVMCVNMCVCVRVYVCACGPCKAARAAPVQAELLISHLQLWG